MSDLLSFLDAWINALSQAGAYNKNDLVPPIAVLWPDKERQWETLIPFLQERLPVLTYGKYEPENRSGPAYWLRCVIAGALDIGPPDNETPIIYLPDISRQDIRAVEECPRHLQPLAELQYRGVLWTQKNGRDWTLMAFLQSDQGGLGIDVGSDNATKEALQRALVKLSGESVAHLKKEAPLRAPFFDSLLNPDDVRRLLLWMNDPVEYPKRGTPEEWQAFCSLCRTKYGFHPEQDGPISAAEKLGQHTEKWQLVWDRYLDSPEAYPNIPDLLRKARPVQMTLFEIADGWPQDNEAEETLLRDSFLKLENLPLDEFQSSLEELEKRHGPRRRWVWARLNQSPLAQALEHLISLSKAITNPVTGATVDEITLCYTETGWKADASAIKALSCIETPDDFNAVKAIIRAIYKPWLEKAVSVFQQVIVKSIAEQNQMRVEPLVLSEGSCVVFSDALRYDAGRNLQKALLERGFNCEISFSFAALPTVTPTAKPAVSPIAHLFIGKSAKEFAPIVEASNTQLSAKVFRDQLTLAGIQVLAPDEYGDPSGKAWTEMGATDTYGHQHGWKIAHHIQGELIAIQKRVQALLDHGWSEVLIVTDHGWLLMPGELPKADLPQHLTEKRKGRCARLKSFSHIDHITIPWYWDDTVQIAFAPGIHCYEAGKEYEHGGLSPQECIVPILSVKLPTDIISGHVDIVEIKWKGLRCEVTIKGASPSMLIDIRTKAGDASTSLVVNPKPPDEDGYSSLPVPHDDRIGEAAFVVVCAPDNQVVAQQLTTIGG